MMGSTVLSESAPDMSAVSMQTPMLTPVSSQFRTLRRTFLTGVNSSSNIEQALVEMKDETLAAFAVHQLWDNVKHTVRADFSHISSIGQQPCAQQLRKWTTAGVVQAGKVAAPPKIVPFRIIVYKSRDDLVHFLPIHKQPERRDDALVV
jgi:hypothetical protein